MLRAINTSLISYRGNSILYAGDQMAGLARQWARLNWGDTGGEYRSQGFRILFDGQSGGVVKLPNPTARSTNRMPPGTWYGHRLYPGPGPDAYREDGYTQRPRRMTWREVEPISGTGYLDAGVKRFATEWPR